VGAHNWLTLGALAAERSGEFFKQRKPLFAIKSLDGLDVADRRVLESGPLELDRRCSMRSGRSLSWQSGWSRSGAIRRRLWLRPCLRVIRNGFNGSLSIRGASRLLVCFIATNTCWRCRGAHPRQPPGGSATAFRWAFESPRALPDGRRASGRISRTIGKYCPKRPFLKKSPAQPHQSVDHSVRLG